MKNKEFSQILAGMDPLPYLFGIPTGALVAIAETDDEDNIT